MRKVEVKRREGRGEETKEEGERRKGQKQLAWKTKRFKVKTKGNSKNSGRDHGKMNVQDVHKEVDLPTLRFVPTDEIISVRGSLFCLPGYPSPTSRSLPLLMLVESIEWTLRELIWQRSCSMSLSLLSNAICRSRRTWFSSAIIWRTGVNRILISSLYTAQCDEHFNKIPTQFQIWIPVMGALQLN